MEEAKDIPTYEEIALKLKTLAVDRGQYAGIPIPMDEFDFITEPRYPYVFPRKEPEGPAIKVINCWRNWKLGGEVFLCKDPETGRVRHGITPDGAGMALTLALNTLGASRGWLMSAEVKAEQKLASLVNDWQIRCYRLTGSFLESSKRSKVTYLFRKLRPTIAIGRYADGEAKALAALCLHPIGYHATTWAGAMCPTDEVVAHLTLMRGDEHYFWKCANQHPITHPQSGL